MSTAVAAPSKTRVIALAGNPNAGKTTLFNALTGMRQKVGNYPGVTVEKKEGRCRLPNDQEISILDLPGTYSLTPKSPDEEIARDILLGLRADTPVPDAVVVVVDASNLERNLYLATQVLELGLPCVVALNMVDVAAAVGREVDAQALSEHLGCPVVELIALKNVGVPELKQVLQGNILKPVPPTLELPPALEKARTTVAAALAKHEEDSGEGASAGPRGVALRLLCGNADLAEISRVYGEHVAKLVEENRVAAKVRPASETGPRYHAIQRVIQHSLREADRELSKSFTDKADAILTHRIWGLAIFALIVLLVFQSIYSYASLPMDWIDGLAGKAQEFVGGRMAEGPLRDLIIDGVIAGVGGVVIFLPQILILFFFIGLLEDSGYMARAAFIMDKLMGKVGLHGRSFIPLLSSFACAIPGIMAARTLSSRRDRMTTILIAPLMSCSARLPVYALMIGAFIPDAEIFGFRVPVFGQSWFIGLTRRTLVMFSLYLLGIVVAMLAGWIFKKTLFKGPTPALMLELPPYKIPAWKNVVVTMWERGSQFLMRAGTVIFALSIILWFLLSYPKIDESKLPPNVTDEQKASLAMDNSIAGRTGQVIEPLIKPLGFNWKIGIGLIASMAAREVFVSTMGTVYSVGEADEESKPLREKMREDKWPDGKPVWTPLVAVSCMVYFVLAMQCLATLGVVKRETNSWTWPTFMLVYMTGTAWVASFLVYQVGKLMGWG